MKARLTILACAATLLAATGAEAQLPPGSYKDTCTNETVTGNTLRARCKTIGGTYLDSSLNLPCPGMVDNINGKLTCKAMPPGLPKPAPKPPSPPAVAPKPPSGPALPDGSFKDTCTGAIVSGNTLRAKCTTKAGGTVDASLTLPCVGTIANLDGKLVCSVVPPRIPAPTPPPKDPAPPPKVAAPPPKAPAPPALPPGSYKDTCTGEAVSGNVLRARCKTISGTWIDSTLNLPCAGKIDNLNGRLTCVGGRVPGR